MTELYIFEADDKYKIGVSENPKNRRDQLQTGNPDQIKIFKTCRFDTSDKAYNYENLLHRMLSSYQTNGEWFVLPDDIIDLFESYDFKFAVYLMAYTDSFNPSIESAISLNQKDIRDHKKRINHLEDQVKKLQNDDSEDALWRAFGIIMIIFLGVIIFG